MSIDHKICEKCRVSTYPSIFGPDEDVNEVPDDKFIGDDALGWWCSVIRGHVYRTDSPPEGCKYILEQIMSTQTAVVKQHKKRRFLGRIL